MTPADVVAALRALGLQAELLTHVDGPSTVRVDVSVPVGTRAESVLRLGPSLASHLGVAEASVRPVDGRALAYSLTVAKPRSERSTVKLEAITGPITPGDWSLTLGVSTDGEVVRLNVAKAPHVLVAGTSGSGKSVGLHALIRGCVGRDDTEVWLVDPKRTEFGAWKGAAGVTRLVTERSDAARLLIDACKEVDKRNGRMERLGVRELDTWRVKDKRAPKRLVVFVDEYADLIAQGSGKEGRALSVTLMGSLQRVAQVGRACGVHLVLATQRPSSECLPGVLKANLDTRLIFRVSSAVDARVCGVKGAELLGGAGDALLMHGGRTVRLQVAWTEPGKGEAGNGGSGARGWDQERIAQLVGVGGAAMAGVVVLVGMVSGR